MATIVETHGSTYRRVGGMLRLRDAPLYDVAATSLEEPHSVLRQNGNRSPHNEA